LPGRQCEDRIPVADLDDELVVFAFGKLPSDIPVPELSQLVFVELVDEPAGDLSTSSR
jgi:hypothetical protein